MEEGRNERKVLIVSMNVDWMNSPILRQGQRIEFRNQACFCVVCKNLTEHNMIEKGKKIK